MSFGDELNTRRRDEVTRLQYQNIGTDQQINDNADPGFFAGTGGGFMSELASAGRSVAIAGGAIPAAIDWAVGDDNRGEPLADWYFRQVDEYTKGAVDYWKPAPAATGTGGAVLGPLAGGLVELAAGGGFGAGARASSIALMLARQDIGTAGELVDQGVDATTAQMVGGAQGLATAIGFRLGTYGNSLMKKMASGAAGNLATNVPAAAVSQAALEHGGYTEQAKQFNPWDMHARAVDVLMGAVFGAAAHFEERPTVTADAPRADVPPSEQHAVLAEAGVKNWSVDTAPGNPADALSMAAHDSAMGTALDQMMRGEQVNVGDKLQGATFEPKPAPAFDLDAAMRQEFGDAYDAQRADFTRPPDMQPPELPAMAPEPPALPPERAAATPERPALPPGFSDARLARSAYRDHLPGMAAELVDGGGTNLGYGADGQHMGRASSLNPDWFQGLPEDAKLPVSKARAAIEKALLGKKLGAREDRFVRAVLDAVQEKRDAYARELQANAGEMRKQIVASRIADKNGPVPDYGFIHDNTDYVPDANAYERAISDISNELSGIGVPWPKIFDLVDSGKTFDQMLAGFDKLRGEYAGTKTAGNQAGGDTQAAGAVAKNATDTKAAAEPPEVAAARAAIARQSPDALINLGDDDNPHMVPAHEAWAQLDNEVQQAQKDAGMFDAAVTCFLGG